MKTGGCVERRDPRAVGAQQHLWAAEDSHQKGGSRGPQQHRQSRRTCGASSSWWHCLVFNPALPSEHLSDVGLPPPPSPPVCRRAVSVGHAGCHAHMKPPCPRAFLSPPIPFSLLHLCSAHSVQAGIAMHVLVWGGPFCNATCCCSVSPVTCRACLGRGGMLESVHCTFIMMTSCSVFQ